MPIDVIVMNHKRRLQKANNSVLDCRVDSIAIEPALEQSIIPQVVPGPIHP